VKDGWASYWVGIDELIACALQAVIATQGSDPASRVIALHDDLYNGIDQLVSNLVSTTGEHIAGGSPNVAIVLDDGR
jgi:hypothetical protein